MSRLSRNWTALAVLLALALLAGCGGGSGSSTSQSVSTAADALTVADLPGASSVGSAGEPCPALPILKEEGGRIASSKAFAFEGMGVQEAIAVYPETRSAVVAFFGLISEARGRCITRSIGALLPSEDEVKEAPSKTLKYGEQALRLRFVVAKPKAVFDFVSLQLGRCAAALFVRKEEGATARVSAVRLGRDAARSLERSCPKP